MELDLPTYPNIWRYISKVIPFLILFLLLFYEKNNVYILIRQENFLGNFVDVIFWQKILEIMAAKFEWQEEIKYFYFCAKQKKYAIKTPENLAQTKISISDIRWLLTYPPAHVR